MREKAFQFGVRLSVICVLIAFLCVTVQTASGERNDWQAGTVLKVKAHQATTGESHGTPTKYDVSMKIGNKIYVVLYAPEQAAPEPEFYVGMARTVLVEGEFVKFNDLLGNIHRMRILSSKDVAPESK